MMLVMTVMVEYVNLKRIKIIIESMIQDYFVPACDEVLETSSLNR